MIDKYGECMESWMDGMWVMEEWLGLGEWLEKALVKRQIDG